MASNLRRICLMICFKRCGAASTHSAALSACDSGGQWVALLDHFITTCEIVGFRDYKALNIKP
jgi:hypothetical protein